MKIMAVELFDNVIQEFKPIDAIVDTGASICTLSSNVATKFGIESSDEYFHHWQANVPLIGKQADIKLRYKEKTHDYNIYYGIYVFHSSSPVNATHNWWSDATGPYHPTANPSGESDNVTDYVLFDPWLTEPVDITPPPPPTNNPPNTPSTPSGPTSGEPGISYTYSTSATDPDGDPIRYGWDWDGDGTVDEWSDFVVSGTTDTRSHYWSSAGTYNVKVKVQDEHGADSNWSPGLTVIINTLPNVPSSPSPADGATDVDINIDLSWLGGDPDVADTVTYDVYFGTGSPSPLVASDIASTTYDPGTLAYGTTYYWQVVAEDNHGATAEGPTWSFTTMSEPNNPPDTPATPSGPTSGEPGILYTYSTTATDPDGDLIRYGWDWDGDGTADEWSELVASGTTDTRPHYWESPGTYFIRVKAQDEYGMNSEWSYALAVSISIAPTNTAPTLTDGSISPETGDLTTEFEFSVKYADIDGNPAVITIVNIDGVDYAMSLTAGIDPTLGLLYTFKLSGFDAGTHHYYFIFSDGQIEVRLPSEGLYTFIVEDIPKEEEPIESKREKAKEKLHTNYTPILYIVFAVVIGVVIILLITRYRLRVRKEKP
jgi:hypothetical protein